MVTDSLGRPLVVFALYFLCEETLEKSTNNNVASTSFTSTPTMIWGMVRIYEVVDRLLRKIFDFPLDIFDFWSDTIDKQGNINFSSYSDKIYASVVLCDSEVDSPREKENADFFAMCLLCFFYTQRFIIEEVRHLIFCLPLLEKIFRRDLRLFCF